MNKSTIIAQSTVSGVSAIAVVRMSGHRAFEIALKLSKKEFFKNQIELSWLYDSLNNKIDQALILNFKAPASFTGEDVIEFHVHGNQLIVENLIVECIKLGAVQAQAGEFTQRAFLNKKLDLIKSEAIRDLIYSKNHKLLKASLNQLNGKFNEKIKFLEKELLNILISIQAYLDFPSDVEDINIKKINFDKCLIIINRLIESARSSNLFRKGLKTAIIGRPNVGKSSLLNCLLNEERSIVSSTSGTTRDFIREELLIGDVPILLIDTAGINKETNCEIEQKGIKKAFELIESIDLILFVFDLSKGFTEEDQRLFEEIKEFNKDAKIIILGNKADLEAPQPPKGGVKFIKISAKENTGLEILIKELHELVSFDKFSGDFELSITQRQCLSLIQCKEILENSKSLITGQLELLSVNLESVLKILKEISSGENLDSEEILSALFGSFCIGK